MFAKQYKDVLIFLALSVIFLMAFAVRTYRLTDRIRWWGDIGRDFLVSKHLAFNGETLINGHSATGITTTDPNTGLTVLLHYPTYYYWYLALLWKILGAVEHIVLFNVLLHCLAILPLYLTLQLLHKNVISSFLACLLYALSFFTINISLIIVGHQVSVPFVITAVYFFTYGWQKNRPWIVFFSLLGLTFLTTFQYTLIVLVGWLCIALVVRAIYKKKWRELFPSIGFGLATIIFFLLIHFNQIQHYGFFTYIKPFFQTTSVHTLESKPIPTLIKERLYDSRVVQLLLSDSTPTQVFFAALVCCFIFITVVGFRTHFRWPILFISGFILLFYILALSKSYVYLTTYLLYADYAWIYLLSFLIPLLSLHHKKYGVLIGGVMLACCIFFLSDQMSYLKSEKMYSEFPRAKTIAEFILGKHQPNTFFRVGADYALGMEDGTIGYWMELLSGEKIYTLADQYRNFEYVAADKSKYILICIQYRIESTLKNGFCNPPEGYQLVANTEFPSHVVSEYVRNP